MPYKKVLEEGKPFNPHNQYYGIFIPDGIAQCQQISDSVKILMGRLFKYAGINGKAYPYRNTLAKECGCNTVKLDRTIRKAKDLKLIKTSPHISKDSPQDNPPNEYVFLYNRVYDTGELGAIKNDKRGAIKNDKRGAIKNDEQKRIIKEENHSKSFSKEKHHASGEAVVKGNDSLNKKYPKIIVKPKDKPIDSTKTTLDPKDRQVAPKKKTPKSKYKHTGEDLKHYKWLVDAGATKHDLTKQAGLDTLDSIHSLLSPSSKKSPCKYAVNNTQDYIDFNWTIDDLVDAFTFQLKHTKVKPIKNIAKFIFTQGFNGGVDYSQLIKWHSAMKKGITGKLTEEGEKLFKSLKYFEVRDLDDLDSRVINKLADEITEISSKYVFVENEGHRTDTYRMGLISLTAKHIKDITNNREYNLSWINKNEFVAKEVIPLATRRNILKPKRHNGINVNA